MSQTLLSEQAAAMLQAAEAYAADLRHRSLLPGHLFVAMLSDPEGVAARCMQSLGADPALLARRVHRELSRLPQALDGSDRPRRDADLDAVLREAGRISRRDQDTLIRSVHLLDGLVQLSRGPVHRALLEVGITRSSLSYGLRRVADLSRREHAAAATLEGQNPAPGTAPPQPASAPAPSRPGARASQDEGSMIEKFGRNLTEMARAGQLDPTIGRDAEIRRLMQVLGRRTKNNPVLVGEPGVGKTAIIHGLAARMASGEVPFNLKDRQLIQIDLGALVAGTSLRGQFEARVKSLMDEVIAAEGRFILFFDEVHTLVSTGGGGDSGGAAGLMKPALARGLVSIVGTTTPAEFRRHIEADKALERRFQEIAVGEPDRDESIAILVGIKQRYEIHHRVRILDEAVSAAVQLGARYVTERNLPDKAVDLIDEAAARLRLQIDSQPLVLSDLRRQRMRLEMDREAARSEGRGLQDLNDQVAAVQQRIDDLEVRLAREKEALDTLAALKQEHEAVLQLIQRAEQERDIGRAAELRYGVAKEIEARIEQQNQVLNGLREHGVTREEVGPEDVAAVVAEWTGIPTTRMLEGERQKLLAFESRLAERVIGQRHAIRAIAAAVRRSRAGLQHRNRPIGNFFFVGPTGVGKTELAKALAELLFDSEDALIRIDMSEYMEQSKVNTLIGSAFGYVDSDKGGLLTEAVRRRPYSVVLFDEAEKAHPDVFNLLLQVLDEGRLSDSQGRRIDFTNTIIIMTSNVGARRILDLTGRVSSEELDREVNLILRDHFRPEFLNRLDDTVVFHALDRQSVEAIADILFRQLSRLLAEQQLALEFTPEARTRVIDAGFQPEFGARPLKRALLSLVQDPLATEVLAGAFGPGDTIVADVDPDGRGLVFRQRGR